MEVAKHSHSNSYNGSVDILDAPHIFPHISGTTNFTQDVTVHSDLTIVFTYIIMGFAWAGKAGLSLREMLVAGFSCTFLGLVIIILERFKLPTYIARFQGALLGAVVILILNGKLHFTPNCTQLLLAMIMPVATGMMIVDGIYTIIKGKKMQGLRRLSQAFCAR
ncbi:MAG: threonine/serine exporter family protein [Oscillospiraceae bacterium]